jgi:integrase
VAKRREAGLQVSSINRQVEVVRQMLRLAAEWGEAEKQLPPVRKLPGENHRERVLRPEEETSYLPAAPPLLKQVATLLIDTAMRPEECFRLKQENHRDGALHIFRGKTASARRVSPLTERAAAILEARKRDAAAEWVFPAPTRSGHIEESSLKKQHLKACGDSKVERFPLYTLRHTCLTRWARTMDPYTLAYLAGHSDFATTKRYVHPQAEAVREANERSKARAV